MTYPLSGPGYREGDDPADHQHQTVLEFETVPTQSAGKQGAHDILSGPAILISDDLGTGTNKEQE